MVSFTTEYSRAAEMAQGKIAAEPGDRVQRLKPTWCNGRTSNLKLFSDLRSHTMAHEQVCASHTHTE